MRSKNHKAWAWCDRHEKLLYLDRKSARAVAREHHGEHKGAYKCEYHQGKFHIGDLGKDVIRGNLSREDLYPSAA